MNFNEFSAYKTREDNLNQKKQCVIYLDGIQTHDNTIYRNKNNYHVKQPNQTIPSRLECIPFYSTIKSFYHLCFAFCDIISIANTLFLIYFLSRMTSFSLLDRYNIIRIVLGSLYILKLLLHKQFKNLPERYRFMFLIIMLVANMLMLAKNWISIYILLFEWVISKLSSTIFDPIKTFLQGFIPEKLPDFIPVEVKETLTDINELYNPSKKTTGLGLILW
ncbi:hypothetical protein COBT_001216 [Conglomerata obtusa]